MIRTRNQNKIEQLNQNKPKPHKKHHKHNKPSKYQAETEVEEQQPQHNKIKIIKPQTLPPPIDQQLPVLPNNQDPDPVVQYQDQIITYLKNQQQKYKINQNYLKFHQVLNNKIRTFLVKFLFKMVWKYECKRSTLYLAVYCMDYYLSKKHDLQSNIEAIAVAQASLNIAMKFQQIYPPDLKQWTPDTEQKKKVLYLEAEILKTLNFKLNLPSVYYFEQYFQKKFFQSEHYKQQKQNIDFEELKINLISDLCLFDVGHYDYQPFQLAKNIRMLVYKVQPPFNEERIVLNIKWTLERNKAHLDWLKENKYKQLQIN